MHPAPLFGRFMAFEPLAGWRQVRVTDHRCRTDWATFVRNLADGRYKDATAIVLVMDQLDAHTPASLYEAFPPEEARRLAGKLEIFREHIAERVAEKERAVAMRGPAMERTRALGVAAGDGCGATRDR